MLPDGDWLGVGSASRLPAVCGFLTSCRKDLTSSGDYETVLIKNGDSETKEGLSAEEVTGETRQCSALAP